MKEHIIVFDLKVVESSVRTFSHSIPSKNRRFADAVAKVCGRQKWVLKGALKSAFSENRYLMRNCMQN